MVTPDLSRLPRGQLEWTEFVDALSDFDDREERYYLELKSDVDLSSEPGRAKVAKFVLGAANRMPELAMRRLNGYGLMVLGVSKGNVAGIQFFEAKDLSATVKKYVGVDGPGWDFERVRISNDRDVIIIVVDPPKWGDQVWTCMKDGPENLKDGWIYIRKDGETAPAKGDEVRQLLERARTPLVDAKLSVQVENSAYRCEVDPLLVKRYISTEKKRLEQAHLRATGKLGIEGGLRLPAYNFSAGALGWEPESRSHEEYSDQIAAWSTGVLDAWDDFVAEAASSFLPTSTIRIQNLSKTWLENVQIEIHLAGNVSADRKRVPVGIMERLPARPREWGPKRMFDRSIGSFLPAPRFGSVQPPRPSDISFRNGGSVDLTINLAELRPEAVQRPVDDDLVLMVTDPDLGQVDGEWRATVRGHHEVYSGRLTVPVQARDVTTELADLLSREMAKRR